MKTVHTNKGFTIAELLIVVAIIAVMVAIAIPVFTAQLENSRESVDLSHIRAAYAEAMADYITDGKETTKTVTIKQTVKGWTIDHTLTTRINGKEDKIVLSDDVDKGSTATVKVTAPDSGSTDPTITVTFTTTSK